LGEGAAPTTPTWLTEPESDDDDPVFDFLVSEEGAEYPLKPPGMTIGRRGTNGANPDIDLRGLDSGMVVSREHAALHFHDGVWHVLELRARNGTWVNEERLVPGVEMPLRSGDKIRLANLELKFENRVDQSEAGDAGRDLDDERLLDGTQADAAVDS
jgi:pSer/pThr/pTyr-binding forkhead associated (FHA) protein